MLLLPFLGFSQGEFNNWFFGNKAAITFNTSPPTNIPSTQMNSVTATASVSDSNGLVLFYSNLLNGKRTCVFFINMTP